MTQTINSVPRTSAWASMNLVVHECPSCFIQFAIPQRMHEEAQRRTRASVDPTLNFHCPNGHSLSYSGMNEEERLKTQLKSEKEHTGYLTAALDQTRASLSAQKGAATRARNQRDNAIIKIKEGICPVKGCGRHFANVRNHIHAKHPDYDIPPDH